ncbi:hypothetical protein ACO2Q1_00340 [Brevundimonas sp. VNH65]|uniref:hypothetical protein n=1 Tax=Brevundimonas sp. VNH65 TaxID=3400917 RepID=UPI003C0BEA7A
MRIVSLSVMSAMFWTGVAVAQPAVQSSPLDPGPVVPKGPAVEARERAITARLNTEVYVADRALAAYNARLAAEHRTDVEATLAANAAAEAGRHALTAAYVADRAADAARADNQALAYDRAMSRWRADVAACEAGDRSRCATVRPD